MANKKITDLVDIGTPASGDLLEIVDISEGVSKRVAVSALGGGSTPTLQEVTDEGNEIVSDDNLNKIVIDKVLQTITFYSRYLITDPWVIASQVTQYGFYVDPTLTIFGGTTVSLDVFTGLAVADDFLNSINITSISATKNGVEFATLDDIPPAITIDATPTDGSANAVSSNGVFDALALKCNKPLVDTVSSSALTGVTTEGILKSYLIPANTLTSSEILNFSNDLYKTGTAGICTSRLYTNTTASLSGASLLATSTSTAGNRKMPLRRQLVLKGGNIEVLAATASTPDDNINSSSVATIVTFNPTVDNYLITTAQNANAGDSTLQNNLKLHY